MASVIHVSQVHYPESDGKPMGETDDHRKAMVRHIETLEEHYRGQRVYVSGNLLLYYEEGNPRRFVVPDALVAKGIAPRPRRTYKTWVEGKAPDVVIETTSRRTKRKDTVEKPELYARLGIREYFLFDPHQEYLEPPLDGYRLVDGAYVRIEPDPGGCLESRELELRLCLDEQGLLQFFRLDTGQRLLSPAERAEAEAERAEAEAERAEAESQRAEAESQRAEAESQRADREAQARQAAEAELARLRAELGR